MYRRPSAIRPEPSHLANHRLSTVTHSLSRNLIVSLRPGLVYDVRMKEYENESNPNHPECPARISRIWSLLEETGLVQRCRRIEV